MGKEKDFLLVGTELEYSQTKKKREWNKPKIQAGKKLKTKKKTKTKMILSCNNVQEVSLKLITLREHIANSTRHVAKAVAKRDFASTS